MRGRRGCDRMVIGFTCAISAYAYLVTYFWDYHVDCGLKNRNKFVIKNILQIKKSMLSSPEKYK
jgi:hypothetical protein